MSGLVQILPRRNCLMIEMTRLRLINWHNFQDDCIPFRMVTYLIGVNAVGKTTIMDAVRYCLTTNKDFNAAGNRKSTRTLQGSVHGKQRGENIYLRPGHTVSYVGVEFIDHEKNTTFVISVRVESESPAEELRHVSQDWFITKPGTQLEDLLFVDQNRRPSKKDAFKASSLGMRVPASQKDAKKYICRILGIGDSESSLGKKFNEVFHMGTSLKDISDIRTFIYTYILPEPKIHVEALQSDMRELERFEEMLQEAQQRAQNLEKIVESGKQALDYQTQVEINEGFIQYARWKKNLTQEEEYQKQAETANLALEQLEPELETLRERQQQAQDALSQAVRNRDEDPEIQATKFYQEQEKDLSKQYREQVKRQSDWDESFKRLKALLAQMESTGLKTRINIQLDEFAALPQERQAEALEHLKTALAELEEESANALYLCRKEMDAANAALSSNKRELKKLREGKMVYPKESELLCEAINAEFQKRGLECDAKIFSEVLYMEDVTWQECAEAALGFRRFDIIVSPSHYQAAKQVFTSMGEKVGDVSLVDTPSLMRDSQRWSPPETNMLAYKIGSENHVARQYVNYLLKGIVCCEAASELEDFSRSVTRDLLRHQGYRLQRMRKPTLCIGVDARKQRIAYLEAQLKENGKRQLELEEQLKQLKDFEGVYYRFIHEKHVSILSSNLDARQKVSELNEELNDIRGKLREYETNPLLAALFDRCKACEEVRDAVEGQLSELERHIGRQEQLVEEAQKAITQNMLDLDVSKAEYDRFQTEHPELREDIIKRYMEASQTRTPAEIEANQKNYHQRCINQRDQHIRNELQPLQQKYNTAYTVDYQTGLEGLPVYQDIYKSLVSVELERFLENLRKAQVRCKERFRKEILFRMKDDIQNAKLQFKDMDRVMSELSYGDEKYHFVINEPKNKELAAFYQIIMDKNNVQITEEGSLFTQAAMNMPAYELQVDELMARIMADVNQAAQDRSAGKKAVSDQISKYVDYRTFLDYDIVIENIATGMKVPLSQVMGDSSGGENQAPFYVAICASLLQIYRQSPNSIRLVLLDEAFNNMTSDRIEPMMKMFAAARLQLILISTVEKASAIFPYCDATYSIVKTGTRAILAPFERLYEEEDSE